MKIRHVEFHPDEWIAGCQGMTVEEEGIYIRMIMRYYSRGEAPPSDPVELAKLCNVRPQVMRRILPKLLSKFDETGGKLRSNRCETEIKLARNRVESARTNGVKGGRPNQLAKPAGLTHGLANQEPRTKNQDSISKDMANGHDDLAAEVFTLGVRILTRRGVPERQARSILGGHRKTLHDDGRLLAILASVERNNPVEPVGYLATAVKTASLNGERPFTIGVG